MWAIIVACMSVNPVCLAGTPPPLQAMQRILAPGMQECLSGYDSDDATLLEWTRIADPVFGKDIRGRSIGDDWRDYLIALRTQAGEKGASVDAERDGSVRGKWERRAKALCEYWQNAASATVHNRDLWPQFLAANGLAATTLHEERIGEFERLLFDTFARGDPDAGWTSQSLMLSQAYVNERSSIARRNAGNRSVNYQARKSQCPAPVAHGYGRPTPEVADRSRSLEKFYPPDLRRSGTEGDVLLSIRVNAAGGAVEAGIAFSSGSLVLDRAALEWYETASYLPAERDGRTVDATALLPMAFRLQGADENDTDGKIAQLATANTNAASKVSHLILRRAASLSDIRIPGALALPPTVVEGDGVFQELMRERCPRPRLSSSQTRISRLLQREDRAIQPIGCDQPRQPMHLVVEAVPFRSAVWPASGWVDTPWPKLARLASEFFAIAEPNGSQSEQRIDAIPFDMILEYDIRLPDGYSADLPLPVRKVELGAASLELRIEQRSDGHVILAAEFRSPQRMYVADERSVIGQGLQRASLDQLFLRFTFDAHKQFANGSEREALATYRAFSAAAPKDAYRHAQYAFGLDRLCLPDEARAELHKALELDRKYAYADYALGWQLMIDPFCRARGPPFDYNGAQQLFRQAVQNAPDVPLYRYDLAQLLEHDQSGARFGREARLEEASREFTDLRATPGYDGEHDDEILEVMLLLGHHADLQKLVSSLPTTAHRHALSVASIAVEKGGDAAISVAKDASGDEDATGQLLSNAASILEDYRFYPQAVMLFEATQPKFGEATQRDSRLAFLKHLRLHENIYFAPSDAREPVVRALEALLGRVIDTAKLETLMSQPLLRKSSGTEFGRRLHVLGAAGRQGMQTGEFADRVIDHEFANLGFDMDGEGTGRFRVRVTGLYQKPMSFFVIRQGEQLRILGTSYNPEALGIAALDALDAHQVDAARQWLTWAHESISTNTDDQSFFRRGFARLWSPEASTSEDELRVAAAALAATNGIAEREADILKDAYRTASGERRQMLGIALGLGYLTARRWHEVIPLFGEVRQSDPRWKLGLGALILSDLMVGAVGEADQALTNAESDVGDVEVKRMRARIAFAQGDVAKARKLFAEVVASADTTNEDRNIFGWTALAESTPDAGALDMLRKLNNDTGEASANSYHTLACLYAVNGRGAEARDALRRFVTGYGGTVSPDQVQLIQGLLAESYGERALARRFYELASTDTKTSSPWDLAHMAKLRLKMLDARSSR